MRRSLSIIAALAALLNGCGLLPQATTPTAPASTAEAQPAASTAEAQPAPTTSASTSTGGSRPAPTTPAPTSAPATASGSYAIDQEATSTSLKALVMTVRSATLDSRGLTLRVSFQNTSDQAFRVIGGVKGKDAVLKDSAGTRYEPTSVSAAFERAIVPRDGLSPGAASVGDITFPPPTGAAPYSFEFPTYTPVSIRLETALSASDGAAIAPGSYALTAEARSQQRALQPIALRVSQITVTDQDLMVEVGFANTDRRRGYSIRGGSLSGKDFRLLDSEQVAQPPRSVSASLENGISPQEGWTPGQVYTGTLTFDRPERGAQVRLTFPQYDALTLTFSGSTAQASVTSATGGAAAPTATPEPEQLAFAAVDALLAKHAAAVTAGDETAYLDTFAPDARDAQRVQFARMRQMPLVTYTLALAPDTDVDADDAEQRVDVVMRYTLRGIDPANTFVHTYDAKLVRTGSTWQIGELTTNTLPPFWQRDDVVLRETPHFLIFARPSATATLDTFANEVEVAYAELTKRQLPLKPRYVAYFTDTTADFAELTGRNAQRTLGLAVARYELDGEQITSTSQAFIINGGVFSNDASGLDATERQTTVTHELVHLAFADVTRPFTPPWLAEGAAVYFAGQNTAETRAALLADTTLDQLDLTKLTTAQSLGEHDVLGTRVGAEYAFSGETFAYLVKTFGEARTLEFYRSYAEVSGAEVFRQMPQFGGSIATNAAMAEISRTTTEAAVQRFFNRTLPQLDADVKAALRA